MPYGGDPIGRKNEPTNCGRRVAVATEAVTRFAGAKDVADAVSSGGTEGWADGPALPQPDSNDAKVTTNAKPAAVITAREGISSCSNSAGPSSKGYVKVRTIKPRTLALQTQCDAQRSCYRLPSPQIFSYKST
jgi:hypothetical protein